MTSEQTPTGVSHDMEATVPQTQIQKIEKALNLFGVTSCFLFK